MLTGKKPKRINQLRQFNHFKNALMQKNALKMH